MFLKANQNMRRTWSEFSYSSLQLFTRSIEKIWPSLARKFHESFLQKQRCSESFALVAHGRALTLLSPWREKNGYENIFLSRLSKHCLCCAINHKLQNEVIHFPSDQFLCVITKFLLLLFFFSTQGYFKKTLVNCKSHRRPTRISLF